MKSRQVEKMTKKNRKKTHDEAMGVDKEEKKAAQPLEKRQEETAQSSTAQSSTAAKQEGASASEAEPDPEHSWEEKKSKRKKQQEKKQAEEQQKKTTKLPGSGGEGWALGKRATSTKKEREAG